MVNEINLTVSKGVERWVMKSENGELLNIYAHSLKSPQNASKSESEGFTPYSEPAFMRGLNNQVKLNKNKEEKMANISEFVRATGTFLKAADITDGAKAKITGIAELVPNEKFGGERLHVPVKIGDKEYTFDSSRTNARTMTSALGEDTSKWVGSELVLEKYKTKTSEGKMTDAINVKEVIALVKIG